MQTELSLYKMPTCPLILPFILNYLFKAFIAFYWLLPLRKMLFSPQKHEKVEVLNVAF